MKFSQYNYNIKISTKCNNCMMDNLVISYENKTFFNKLFKKNFYINYLFCFFNTILKKFN